MRASEARERDLLSRSRFGAAAAGMGARMGGAMTDPINIATLPLGGPGKTIGGTALRAGAAGIATETAIQPMVQSSRAEAGLEAGFDQGAVNVAFAGVGGAAFGGALDALGKAPAAFRSKRDAVRLKTDPGRWAAAQMEEMLDTVPDTGGRSALLAAFDEAEPQARGVVREYRDAVELEVARDAANPLDAGGYGRAQYRLTLRQVMDGEPIEPLEMDIKAKPGEAAGQSFAGYEVVDPRMIRVDAERFQFKSGGDRYGVTDRLQGVTTWDPIKAKPLLVWEGADGKRFVADGHQRTGLATRLMNEQPGLKIEIAARVLREEDGISAEMARAIAAGVNLAEGTGSTVDAAKVLRTHPELLDGSMPMTSTGMRHARALSALEDDAFMLVVNEIATENQGAVVGRLAADRPELQADLLGLLAKLQPANEFQAESIVAQALSGPVRRETQTSLFGEEELARSLYLERARVLDSTLRRLKQDQALFNRLLRDEARIAGQGANQLDRAANQQKVQTDAETEFLLTRLANRVGPVSEALDAAATRIADGEPIGGVVTEFAQLVRDRAGRGAGDGNADSGGTRAAGDGSEGAPPSAGRTEGPEDALDAFEGVAPAETAARGGDGPENGDGGDLGRELSARELDDKTFDMFGDSAADVPTGRIMDDGEGARVETRTREELQADLDQETGMLERLRGCAYG